MILIGYALGRVRLADISGVLSGILMGLLIVSFTDFRWFVLILSFFVIGGIFTKYKYDYKRAIGIAQGGVARGGTGMFLVMDLWRLFVPSLSGSRATRYCRRVHWCRSDGHR